MDEELRGMLVERIENVCHDLAKKGAPFAINDTAKQVMDDLKADDNKRWKELRDHFAQDGVMKYVNRVITQAKAADPAQRHVRRRSDPCGTAQLREVPSRSRAPGDADQLVQIQAPQARTPRTR